MTRNSRSKSQRSVALPSVTPAVASPASDRLRSSWIGLAVLVALAPTLAHAPQSGDGAEIVAVALRGGVLHPTGFPLQAWIDRALALAPGVSAAFAISLLGLAAHAGAAGLMAETLRLLGVEAPGRVLGAAAFALFPALWTLAVEPEVFSLAHLLIAAALWAAVKLALSPPRWPVRAAAALGLLGAGAASQHPIALAGLPALVFALARVVKPEPRRGAAVLAFAGTLIGGTALAYASLPLLRTASPWPDWGALSSAGDVVRHALRVDYGTFAMSAAEGQATRSALTLWGREVVRSWSVLALLALVGAGTLIARPERRIALAPIGGALAVGLAILARGRLPDQSYSDAYLAKLQGPVVLAMALLIGLGWDALARRAGTRLRPALAAAVAIAVAAALALGWPPADASRDRTLDLFAEGVGLELPADAVYVTEGEVESFLGAPTRQGRRYPVSNPMASLDWYAQRVAPRLEPRVLGKEVSIEDWDRFLQACFGRGLTLASTSRDLIATTVGVPELRGLVYVARAGNREELTVASVVAAVRLAPLADELPALPPGSHEFSRFYVRRFARAYAGAAAALARLGAGEAANRANEVAMALDRGDDPARRQRLIEAFVTEARAMGFR